MKNIALLPLIFCSMLIDGRQNDYISFEYVGDGSKPLTAVYISTKQIPRPEMIMRVGYSDFPEDYIVSNDEFMSIRELINSTAKKFFDTTDYNGFETTIRENDTIISYFITRKNSDSLFIKSNAYLKHDTVNNNLILQLEALRRTHVY